MRVVIQRVSKASVTIANKTVAQIDTGLLILVGVASDDTQEDISWLSTKITNLRIFNDIDNKMNLSIKDINAELLVVSQFTLHASTKKGNRPSYIKAAKPDIAIPLYKSFIKQLELGIKKKVQTGVFGADMKLELINDGPVTINIDTKDKQ